MTKIIVGVDASEGANDAISLASGLAGITGAELMLVNVFPYDLHPSRAASAAYEHHLRQDGEALLARVRAAHGDEGVETRTVANPSPAHGIHDLAEREDAAMIIVGSTHTGAAGRVFTGSTAERLLHGAPCPVAVAPKGYASREERELRAIGCAFDGSLSSRRALAAADRIAALAGARLRVIRAFRPASEIGAKGVPMGGIGPYNDTLREQAAAELAAAVEQLGSERAEGVLPIGDPASILANESLDLDLLVVGSRGYGPMHAVIVGGVAGRLVRESACPVIVFPRTAGHTGDDSPFAQHASAQGQSA